MNLFDLTAKLTLDKSDYDKNINEAKVQSQQFSQTSEKTSAKSVVSWMAIATAVIAVVKGVKDAIVSSANYADQIGDTAQKWGFATKEIQEFDYWATMNGTTLESLLTGMRGLVNQAEAGANAFKVLGLNVRNNDGTLKGQKQLFLETITALQGVENQTERNALQFEIFGRAGIELGQIINKSSEELNGLSKEAENLGIILSEETINQAGDFNDKLDQLKLSFKSVLAGLISGDPDAEKNLDKFLDNLGQRVEEWAPKFVKITSRLLVKVVESLIKMLPTILDSLMESVSNIMLEFDWVEIGKSIINFILKGVLYGLANSEVMKIISSIFGIDIKGINSKIAEIDLFGQKANNALNSINSVNNDTNVNTDNSSTNVTVNMTSSGYTTEDARNIANEVIKEIATKKQASGR